MVALLHMRETDGGNIMFDQEREVGLCMLLMQEACALDKQPELAMHPVITETYLTSIGLRLCFTCVEG